MMKADKERNRWTHKGGVTKTTAQCKCSPDITHYSESYVCMGCRIEELERIAVPLDDEVKTLLAEYDDMTIVDIAVMLQSRIEAGLKRADEYAEEAELQGDHALLQVANKFREALGGSDHED